MIIGLEIDGLLQKLEKDIKEGGSSYKVMATIKRHSMGRIIAITRADIVRRAFSLYAEELEHLLPEDIWKVVTRFPEDVIDAVMDAMEDIWSDSCTVEDALVVVKEKEGRWTYFQLCAEALSRAGIEVDEEENDNDD